MDDDQMKASIFALTGNAQRKKTWQIEINTMTEAAFDNDLEVGLRKAGRHYGVEPDVVVMAWLHEKLREFERNHPEHAPGDETRELFEARINWQRNRKATEANARMNQLTGKKTPWKEARRLVMAEYDGFDVDIIVPESELELEASKGAQSLDELSGDSKVICMQFYLEDIDTMKGGDICKSYVSSDKADIPGGSNRNKILLRRWDGEIIQRDEEADGVNQWKLMPTFHRTVMMERFKFSKVSMPEDDPLEEKEEI